MSKGVIRKIKKTTNYEDWIAFITDRPFNDNRYFINSEKLIALGWKQKINFDDGIDSYINRL